VKQGKVKGTLIAKEISSAEGDPYYPVPNPDNRALYERYRELAEKEEGVCFVGRLASYKYFNMDQVCHAPPLLLPFIRAHTYACRRSSTLWRSMTT